jgi:hypothetical protein
VPSGLVVQVGFEPTNLLSESQVGLATTLLDLAVNHVLPVTALTADHLVRHLAGPREKGLRGATATALTIFIHTGHYCLPLVLLDLVRQHPRSATPAPAGLEPIGRRSRGLTCDHA